jgi:hypothetical protein
VRGGLARLNAALEALRYTPPAGFHGAATLTVAADALGNTSAGGAQRASVELTVDVARANASPVVAIDVARWVGLEDVALPVGLSLSARDADGALGARAAARDGAPELAVNVSCARGVLTAATRARADDVAIDALDGGRVLALRAASAAALAPALRAVVYTLTILLSVARDAGATVGLGGAPTSATGGLDIVDGARDGRAKSFQFSERRRARPHGAVWRPRPHAADGSSGHSIIQWIHYPLQRGRLGLGVYEGSFERPGVAQSRAVAQNFGSRCIAGARLRCADREQMLKL